MTNTRPMQIVIVALAAGASRRFGPEDKLLADIDGRPMVVATLSRLAAGAALAGQPIVTTLIAIVRDRHSAVAAAIRRHVPAAAIVVNSRAEDGIGTSVAVGVTAARSRATRARLAVAGEGQIPAQRLLLPLTARRTPSHLVRRGAPAAPDGILISPTDMPRLAPATIARLLLAFARHGGRYPAHCVMPDGTPTSPVIWPRTMFRRLQRLSGDRGGRGLLAGLRTIDVVIGPDEGHDVDQPSDLAPKR